MPIHRFEQRKEVDRTHLLQGRVPFRKMTATGGFAKLMLEEADARKIKFTPDERKKISIVKKKIMQHEGNTKSFKPVLEYSRFKWYKADTL